MSGSCSRRKGRLAEQQIVSLARQHGLDAERTWATAQSPDPGARCCDVLIGGKAAQVKIAASGFSSLYAALANVEMAFLRQDRQPWLAVLPAEVLFSLLKLTAITELKQQ